MGCFVLVHLTPPSTATDCPGAHGWPDPVKGGGPQDTICQLVRSMPRLCRECMQARRAHIHYWLSLWVTVIIFTQVGSACDFHFLLCDFKTTPQWVDDFCFLWLLCHFVLNKLHKMHQWRFSAWIIHSSRSDVCSINLAVYMIWR